MSKKPEKTYIVRGFNFLDEDFFNNPSGVIEDKSTFNEIVVKTQAEAITTMLCEEDISTMSVSSILTVYNDDLNIEGFSDVNVRDPKEMIHVVDLYVFINTSNKQEVRLIKSDLREVIKHWSEKSRVKNLRGFRASAIRTPVFEYGIFETVMKVQVILSNAIVYNNHNVDIKPREFFDIIADLKLLKKELTKRLPIRFSELSYNHSKIGKGDVQ